MKVFRLLSEEELNLIKNNKRRSLGKYFDGINLNSTFKYKIGERYMHFFFRREDCELVRKIHRAYLVDGEQNFIAEFHIPLKKIIGHIGRGFYPQESETKGFEANKPYEIAIPVSIFEPRWLKRYEQVSLDEVITRQESQPE